MALIFGFSPLIAGLIGHMILKTHKLVWLQWLGMAVAVARFCFVFATRQTSKINPSGCSTDADQYGRLISARSSGLNRSVPPWSPMSQATGSLLVYRGWFSHFTCRLSGKHMPTQLPGTQAMIGFIFTMIM